MDSNCYLLLVDSSIILHKGFFQDSLTLERDLAGIFASSSVSATIYFRLADVKKTLFMLAYDICTSLTSKMRHAIAFCTSYVESVPSGSEHLTGMVHLRTF